MVAKAIVKLLKEGVKKGSKKLKDTRSKVDEAFTPKKLKEEEKALKAKQRKRRKKEKEQQANPFETKAGRKAYDEGMKPTFGKQTKRRLKTEKKETGELKGRKTESSRKRQAKTLIGGAALTSAGAAGIGKAVVDSRKEKQEAADKKKADERARGQMTGFAKTSKARTEKMAAEKKKKEAADKKKADAKKKEASSKIKTSLFGKVTGKGPKDRNVTRGGKKLANVTREQLTKLGLDPSKKSDLRKYLNAFDRMGTRPTKKSDLVAGKMMGGMMKKKGYAMGGMMKSKGMAKGGAMKKKGYAMGGSANLKKAGPDQEGLKKLPTAVRNKMGYMAKGGMTKKKGYASGGMMKKKGYSKGGTVRKSKRGMGAANRGGGAIM